MLKSECGGFRRGLQEDASHQLSLYSFAWLSALCVALVAVSLLRVLQSNLCCSCDR